MKLLESLEVDYTLLKSLGEAHDIINEPRGRSYF